MRLPIALLILVVLAGCAPRQAPPPAEPQAAPVPAKPASPWGETLGEAVAGEFAAAAAAETWAVQFRDRQGRAAQVAVGRLDDRSGKDVPVESFAAALARALDAVPGERVKAVGTGTADFTVVGAVRSQDEAGGVRFLIDLRVLDAAGEAVWPFSIEKTAKP